MTEVYDGDQWLNKREIQQLTGLTIYYIDRALDALEMRPTIRPGRANEKLFSPEQVRAIQTKVEELLQQKL